MTKELDTFYGLIDDIEIAMMTTRRPDGHLESRAMANQKRAAGADLWFVTADGTAKLRDLAADPHVNLSYYKDRTREWISVSGVATISRDRQKIRRALRGRLEGVVSRRGRRAPWHRRRSAHGVDRREDSRGGVPGSEQAAAGRPLSKWRKAG